MAGLDQVYKMHAIVIGVSTYFRAVTGVAMALLTHLVAVRDSCAYHKHDLLMVSAHIPWQLDL